MLIGLRSVFGFPMPIWEVGLFWVGLAFLLFVSFLFDA
jgi:hypothetical protein